MTTEWGESGRVHKEKVSLTPSKGLLKHVRIDELAANKGSIRIILVRRLTCLNDSFRSITHKVFAME